MQTYKFKSLEGVSFSFVAKIIAEMVGRESCLSMSPFDADAYELSIGQDVFNVFPKALKHTKKLCDIDVLIMYSVDKANCIILDKKDDGKFKDLSPKIFDTVYDDIIKELSAVEVKLNVDAKTADICKILLSIYYENLGYSGALLNFKDNEEILISTVDDIHAATDALMQGYLY